MEHIGEYNELESFQLTFHITFLVHGAVRSVFSLRILDGF